MGRKRKVLFPCVFCDSRCSADTIECSSCKSWAHRKCAQLTTHDYERFATDGMIFLCPHCLGRRSDGSIDWSVLLNRYSLPFAYMDNSEPDIEALVVIYKLFESILANSEHVWHNQILERPMLSHHHQPIGCVSIVKNLFPKRASSKTLSIACFINQSC